MNTADRFQPLLRRVSVISLIVGIVASVASVAVASFAPEQFFPAYLVSFLYWLGISLGALAVSMLHHLTGGRWGVPIRRTVESAAGVVPLMALLFLPIWYGMSVLYPWANPETVAGDAILQRKAHYLNVDGFLLRAVIYFVLWAGFAFLLNWLTRLADPPRQARKQRRLAILSGLMLALWGLSVTFASVDWAMSLEPHWFSSMYGVLFVAGQAVSGLALAIIVVIKLQRFPEVPDELTTDRMQDLGTFMLAFVMFWAYVSFMQFLIIWSANLPEETPWYLARGQGFWQWVAMALAILHFFLPFLLLLMRQVKRVAPRLMLIAVLLLLMRLVEMCWMILPAFGQAAGHGAHDVAAAHGTLSGSGVLNQLWPLLVTVPAIGGLWVALFSWRLSVRGLIPVYQVQQAEELELNHG